MSVYFSQLRCSDNFCEYGTVFFYYKIWFTSAFSVIVFATPFAELYIFILIFGVYSQKVCQSYFRKLKFNTKLFVYISLYCNSTQLDGVNLRLTLPQLFWLRRKNCIVCQSVQSNQFPLLHKILVYQYHFYYDFFSSLIL